MEQIRTGLHRIMSDFLRKQSAEEAAKLGWPVVCGSKAASRTQAVEFEDGSLTVEVSDSNWLEHLIALEKKYVAEYADLIGPVVKRVRFKTPGNL